MTEEVINEQEITVAQPWRGALKRQVHNIIVSTLEASEAMVEELDPDSDPEELYIELMAVALKCRRCNGRRLQRKLYGDSKERGAGVSGRRGRGRRLASKFDPQRESRGGLRVALLFFGFRTVGTGQLLASSVGSKQLADIRQAHRQRRLRRPQHETRVIRAELRCETDRSEQQQFLAHLPTLLCL
jgi:hypothetical protein